MKITMEVLAELIRANMPNSKVQITRTWKEFDGSNMESSYSWETIIVYYPEEITLSDGSKYQELNSYQALTPAVHEKLVNGTFTIQDAEVFINKMVERGW